MTQSTQEVSSSTQEAALGLGQPPNPDRSEGDLDPGEKKTRNKVRSKGERKRREEKETKSEVELRFGARHVVLLFIPVSITMLLCLFAIQIIKEERNLVAVFMEVHSLVTPLGSDSSSTLLGIGSSGSAAGDAILNALIFIGFIAVLTFLIVLLFICRCYKVLAGFMGFFLSLGLYVIASTLILNRILRALNVVIVSLPLMILWCINFGVAMPMAVFWKAPRRLTQAAICLGTGVVATLLTLLLKKWALWVILGLLALWDIFAVLAPCGPLRMLVEKAQERADAKEEGGKDFGKGMLYATLVWLGTGHPSSDSDSGKRNREAKEEDHHDDDDDDLEEKSAKLGLGDFVFYSILLAKCSNLSREMSGNWEDEVDWPLTVGAFVSILVGLALTLLYLSVKQKALPALPLSILTGLLVTFLGHFIARPFLLSTALHQAFI